MRIMLRFIRYICYWNLQFLDNVIIIKTKVLFTKAQGDLSRIWLDNLFGPLVF